MSAVRRCRKHRAQSNRQRDLQHPHCCHAVGLACRAVDLVRNRSLRYHASLVARPPEGGLPTRPAWPRGSRSRPPEAAVPRASSRRGTSRDPGCWTLQTLRGILELPWTGDLRRAMWTSSRTRLFVRSSRLPMRSSTPLLQTMTVYWLALHMRSSGSRRYADANHETHVSFVRATSPPSCDQSNVLHTSFTAHDQQVLSQRERKCEAP